MLYCITYKFTVPRGRRHVTMAMWCWRSMSNRTDQWNGGHCGAMRHTYSKCKCITLTQWSMYGPQTRATTQGLNWQAEADTHIKLIGVTGLQVSPSGVTYAHCTLIQERWLYTWAAAGEAWTAFENISIFHCVSIADRLPRYYFCQARSLGPIAEEIGWQRESTPSPKWKSCMALLIGASVSEPHTSE